MNISLVAIAYNSPDMLAKLIQTARETSHQINFHLFLHSQHAPTVSMCEGLAAMPDVVYYAYGTNRGLSKSWNEGMLNAWEAGADVVIIANDDIFFSLGDVDKLAEKALRCRDNYIVTCAGFHLRFKQPIPSHGYSCFAINPVALEKIGCFDENFMPIYCEDQDYAWRAKLAGLQEENCPDTMVHHGGSCTIFADPELLKQNGVTHGRNIEYYRRKWGGGGGQERFAHPFDNPRYDYYIAPERRHAPYGPAYDRSDSEIVRV
jgi:GT2 family glycosyltransferase